MSKPIFVTTTIPYVNSKPHVGFALELVQADAFARYHRLKGENVLFQSGTDENSLKNVLAAGERGVDVQAHVDEHAAFFHELAEQLQISLDQFVRTSSTDHHERVKQFWKRLNSRDLYRRKYGGLYCTGCEDFLRSNDLICGLCADHGVAPDVIEEENFYFRLSDYQGKLKELIERGRVRITPAFREKEILNFIESGLEDISISRHFSRSDGWGVSVPVDSTQIVYVWIDALVNYLAQQGSDSRSHEWTSNVRKVHFIGKNVWKFHAVYWPALLLSAGLDLPDDVVIHGFLTAEGSKISKSSRNSVDPFELIQSLTSDSLRFYLLRAFSPFEDGDFLKVKIREYHNSYLVNGLGNLTSRLLALAVRVQLQPSELRLSQKLVEGLDKLLSEYRVDEGVKAIWRQIDRINLEISSERPWERLDSRECRRSLVRWLEELWNISYWLSAFLPNTSQLLDTQIRNCNVKQPHLFSRL